MPIFQIKEIANLKNSIQQKDKRSQNLDKEKRSRMEVEASLANKK
tara:strand:+ start:769 stop:903 length:135 start_codon:yes stop_codon:yes gene_type:complete